uniref:Uncharacterized protein n=1 Tax=Chromera velia CCMP2878 TaxID=1169474 RepID=A0A0G4HF44_9ALVE|eukprot:Cvel_26780.t1-p1 / transcript=Cvel_26780.t1 / gene=Cvel_26780 / organism=Chromera_velia_CCMP2878 / gene_product=Lysosomal acid phosphatase, putative / transcript_product=Lysosomal acid phosphatase, putative / location=Cvel_scaffold3240:12308-15499(-) / protein_length=580 / sequence_SO=supercontig / SO=protein_coding / is_pseudo=false
MRLEIISRISTSIFRRYLSPSRLSFVFFLLLAVAGKKEKRGSGMTFKKLHFVVELARHGARTPRLEQLKGLPGRPWNLPGGFLTAVGEAQHAEIGRSVRQRFVEDLGFLSLNFNSTEVHARSTMYARTLMSAQAQLAGIYPPGSRPTLGEWQRRVITPESPVHSLSSFPVFSHPKSTDFLLMAGDAPCIQEWQKEDMRKCPVWAEAERRIAPLMKPIVEEAYGPGVIRFALKSAQKLSPGLFQAFHFHDALICMRTDGREDEVPKISQTYEEALAVASRFVFSRLYSASHYGGAESFRFWSLVVDWLLWKRLEVEASSTSDSRRGAEEERGKEGVEASLRQRLEEDAGLAPLVTGDAFKKTKFLLLASHDSTLIPVLTSLFDGWPGQPPEASALFIELWEEREESTGESSFSVSLTLNGEPLRIPWCPVGTIAGAGGKTSGLTAWRRGRDMPQKSGGAGACPDAAAGGVSFGTQGGDEGASVWTEEDLNVPEDPYGIFWPHKHKQGATESLDDLGHFWAPGALRSSSSGSQNDEGDSAGGSNIGIHGFSCRLEDFIDGMAPRLSRIGQELEKLCGNSCET